MEADATPLPYSKNPSPRFKRGNPFPRGSSGPEVPKKCRPVRAAIFWLQLRAPDFDSPGQPASAEVTTNAAGDPRHGSRTPPIVTPSAVEVFNSRCL